MANFFDYVDWRGDIIFPYDEFNEVDNLILSWLSYIDLDDIMPQGVCDVNVSIKDVSIRYFEKFNLEDKLKERAMSRTSALLLEKCAKRERFRDIEIINYVNRVSTEAYKQFAVMTFKLSKDLIYVAFRGTDDSIVAWREDFNMCFLPSIPSQLDAVEYLNYSLQNYNGKIILGGHSKGGNLAVYAGIHCDERLKKNIIKIYNNDGPGFMPEVLESKEYQEMLPKITTIVPDSSIVGMLLGHEEKYEIVKSTQRGIMQHDAGSWEVHRKHFVYLDTVSVESKFLDKTIKEWIREQNEEERKIFVDSLFSILEAPGAKTLGEIYELGVKYVGSVIKSYTNLTPEMRQMMNKVIKSLLEIISTNLKAQFIKE